MDPSGAVIGTSIISPLCQGCGIEQTLSTFADEAKPRGVVAKEGQDANQRDLGRLERQTWLRARSGTLVAAVPNIRTNQGTQ